MSLTVQWGLATEGTPVATVRPNGPVELESIMQMSLHLRRTCELEGLECSEEVGKGIPVDVMMMNWPCRA